MDSGQSVLLYPGTVTAEQTQTEEARHHSRIVAQRFYEMSAEQGSASSELRLGDYAYYGWGVSADFGENESDDTISNKDDDDRCLQLSVAMNLSCGFAPKLL